MSRGRMRWDCSPDKDGCYRRLGQPDLTVLDECFPGRIAMTDVDGLVEINGRFLFIEWKRGGDVPAGQRIMFERLTRHPEFTILVILGDPRTMEVERYDVFRDGRRKGWRECGLSELKRHVRTWAERASRASPASPASRPSRPSRPSR